MALYKDRYFLQTYSLGVTLIFIFYLISLHTNIHIILPFHDQPSPLAPQPLPQPKSLSEHLELPPQPFPIQTLNFSSTAHLERRAQNLRPSIEDNKFLYYDNHVLDCTPYVGDRVGVFNASPAPDYRSHSHGLLHERGNLLTYLREAKELNRTAVVGNIVLSQAHNKNGWVCAPWSRYADMERLSKSVGIFVGIGEFRKRLPNGETWEYFGDSESIDVLKKSKAKVVVRVLKTHIAYSLRHNGKGLDADVGKIVEDSMRESEYVREKARQVWKFMGGEDGRKILVIKVRRGDKLKESYKCLSECTMPERILDLLDEYKVDKDKVSLYILSNEKQTGFFDDIKRRGYRVVTADDVPFFKEEDIAKDNYMLFAIELALSRFSSGMIGTFIKGIRYWGEKEQEPSLFRDKLTGWDRNCLDEKKAQRMKTCQTECTKCFLRYERETPEETAKREAREKAARKW